MTAIDVDTIAFAVKPEPPRDGRGRYIIPNPKGKPTSHTRTTTVAKTLSDTEALTKWKLGMTAYGLANEPDLIGLAASHHPKRDPKVYKEVLEGAMEAAGANAARRNGNTLHRFTEEVDLGLREVESIPEPYRTRVQCYRDKLTEAGVVIHRQWAEQVLVNDHYTIAGTDDRIVDLADGRRIISDLKTGSKVYDLEVSIQLAVYANHTATYDQVKDKRGPRIDVDTDTAMVIHLPFEGDYCELYLVDIRQGYDAFIHAMETREWRKAKTLTPYRPANGGTGGAGAVRDWLKARIQAVATTEAALADLVNRWPTTVPQPLPAELSQVQAIDLDAVLTRVEANHEIPFGQPWPGVQATTKPPKKRTTK